MLGMECPNYFTTVRGGIMIDLNLEDINILDGLVRNAINGCHNDCDLDLYKRLHQKLLAKEA